MCTYEAIPGCRLAAFGTAQQRPQKIVLKDAPGPGAYASLERDNYKFDSTKKRIPAAKMKFRTAFGDPSMVGEKANYPAPCDYPNAKNPMHSHAPVPRLLGKAPAWANKNPTAEFPGPGSYRPVDSVGAQVLSTKRTAGAASFGRGQRPNSLYRDKQLKAGPGDYSVVDSMGEQAESTRKTAPAATIRSRRAQKTRSTSDRIGPGQYAVKQAMGKQIESKNKTAPAARMSGRTKFGSMYYM